LDIKFRPALYRLRVGESCLSLSKLALGLIQRRLKRPRVDLEKELALLNKSTLLIALLQQIAGDLRSHVGVHQSIERTNPFRINRNIFLLDLNDLDIGRA
jgi:hypothetical protein